MAISGWPTEAVRFLTGAPSYSYYVSSYTDPATSFWSLITSATANNYIVTAGTPSDSTGATFNSVGLVTAHAYTVLGYVTLVNADGTTKAKLVRMRNPWASDVEYIGSWSDSDSTWNTAGETYAT